MAEFLKLISVTDRAVSFEIDIDGRFETLRDTRRHRQNIVECDTVLFGIPQRPAKRRC